jgi:hypothetical protein
MGDHRMETTEAGVADGLRWAQQDRGPGAWLPGIDALDRILAASRPSGPSGPTGRRAARRRAPARLEHATFEHAGLALLLLVNRSIDRRHADPLTRDRWPYVDGYICTIAERFADVLNQPEQPPRSPFWRGSALAGLRTLLGRHLAVTQDRSGFASEVRITDPATALDHQIAGFLRRHGITPAQAGAAFDALVAAYRQLQPHLASFGQGGEWPADTQRLRARLLALLEPDGTVGALPVVSGLDAW